MGLRSLRTFSVVANIRRGLAGGDRSVGIDQRACNSQMWSWYRETECVPLVRNMDIILKPL